MTSPRFAIDGNRLDIICEGNDVGIEFKWPIAQVLPQEKVYFVRTEPAPGVCDNQNVYAVDLNGKLVWQVRLRKHVYEDSPYTNIEVINELR